MPRNPEKRKRSRVTYQYYHRLALMIAEGRPVEDVLRVVYEEQNRKRAFRYGRVALAALNSIDLVVSDLAAQDRQTPIARRIPEWRSNIQGGF